MVWNGMVWQETGLGDRASEGHRPRHAQWSMIKSRRRMPSPPFIPPPPGERHYPLTVGDDDD
eukprot:359470-Chlamydomonas_euryale.AAC.2